MCSIRYVCLCLLVVGSASQLCASGLAKQSNLFGLKIDANAEQVICRSLPFLAALPENRGQTQRVVKGNTERIPVAATADTLYFLGMINEGWDYGVAHWGYHPELLENRRDQLYVGRSIGRLEICYTDGESDSIDLVIGATAWFVEGWARAPTFREPFLSRPEYMKVLRRALKLQEHSKQSSGNFRHKHYYLAVKPRNKRIDSLLVHDNPEVNGSPLISGVTLAGAKPSDNLVCFNGWRAEESDLQPRIDVTKAMDWSEEIEALAQVLYTSESDIPEKIELIDFPADFDAARIRFLGGREANMLSNVWAANLMLMDEKFDPRTGVFRETASDSPWYGSYTGIGTWISIGVHAGEYQAYSRCADHFATVVLRNINDTERLENFVDYVDRGLYYYRTNHDPAQGPPNDELDMQRYPADAPPHWGYMPSYPSSAAGTRAAMPGMGYEINELVGCEAMEGHGSIMVARWVAWSRLGKPTSQWLKPRPSVFGKSRWDSTCKAADFICWFMDYTGMDVIFSEEEATGWAGGPPGKAKLVPKGMSSETDPEKIRKNYANSNMYEPYATWVCCVALRCSAQIADAIGQVGLAKKWLSYAARLRDGMYRLLKVGDHTNFMWRVSPLSIFPSLQDSLVHAWFSIYYDGYDPQRWDGELTEVTRNTLRRQLSRPYGHAPVLAMGYGQGWLTKAALLLDEMDDAGPLLCNIAKYAYDKNMDYVDEKQGIDWRRWLWIIPEGTNILPDGRWHRIGDLSNSANQGPPMHAIEVCAGVDDTDPYNLRIMPRVPQPLTGIKVSNFFTLIPEEEGLTTARINYRYEKNTEFLLNSNRVLPSLAVRLGPFVGDKTARCMLDNGSFPTGSTQRIEVSGHFKGQDAWWIWIEGLHNIREVRISLSK